MSLIRVCSTPKNDAGEYSCPYCGYTSEDIENFAVGMCWDCVFSPEQDLEGEDIESLSTS